ncbi:disease resistance protein RPM1-like [Macadamia integrifolia]|uniref:disease resistance protein RPM1-like n=1 Tax=Macadamia integrifolia TaxID=60698 RepID=UPI001C4F033E|nr:disease resistance protein RPM1-like [Macadamia integrifolia]
MTNIVLKPVLQTLIDLLVSEAKLQIGLRKDVESIRDDLEFIIGFVKVARGLKESEPTFNIWLNQVRDLACQIEDLLDDFLPELGCLRHHRNASVAWLLKLTQDGRHLLKRHNFATEIKNLKSKLADIRSRRETFNLGSNSSPSLSSTPSQRWYHVAQDDALRIGYDEIVGIEDRIDDLCTWLYRAEQSLSILAVHGGAGLGKTTLVRKVFERLKDDSFTSSVWVDVSKSQETDDLIRRLIYKFCKDGQEIVSELAKRGVHQTEDLKDHLLGCLQEKRYLIVFDNIWHIDQWKSIRYAIPNNRKGSRIILTTRLEHIAIQACEANDRPYSHQPLSHEHAWTLFCRKAFKSRSRDSCPSELKGIAESFVRRCSGVPLSIVAVAGSLSTKPRSYAEWLKVDTSFSFHLHNMNEIYLRNAREVLLLSYHDLDPEHEACLLYFSLFPIDSVVKCTKLLRIWIADGIVERAGRYTLEEAAEFYLKELIQRNIVVVCDRHLNGRPRTCRLHNLMHEIIIAKAKDQNFSRVFNEAAGESVDTSSKRIRRLLVMDSEDNIPKNCRLTHVRSCFLFGLQVFPKDSVSDLCSRFRLLKILDLEDAPIEGLFPKEILDLFHLRFLGMKNTKITSLPEKFGKKLRNLVSVNFKGTSISRLPNSMLKLPHLRHLLVYRRSKTFFGGKQGVVMLEGSMTLNNLQDLSCVDAGEGVGGIIKQLDTLTQLRRLGITNLKPEDGSLLCAAIAKMQYLQALHVTSSHSQEEIHIQIIHIPSTSTKMPPSPQPLRHLRRLHMQGVLKELPNWISSLVSLTKLKLGCSRLRIDPLEGLKGLEQLVELVLFQQAYDGEDLHFPFGGFKNLKKLDLLELLEMRTVTIEEGTMSSIEKIKFEGCNKLTVPSGIHHLTTLKEIRCIRMPDNFCDQIKNRDQEHFPDIITFG